jgi:hypothetical protein
LKIAKQSNNRDMQRAKLCRDFWQSLHRLMRELEKPVGFHEIFYPVFSRELEHDERSERRARPPR